MTGQPIVVTALDDNSPVYIPREAISYVRRHGAANSTVRLVSGESIAAAEPPDVIVGQMTSKAAASGSPGPAGGKVRASANKGG